MNCIQRRASVILVLVAMFMQVNTSVACFCDCYFDTDCGPSNTCSLNPSVSGNFCTTESVCLCMAEKPNGVVGANCDTLDSGGSGNCDGICTAPSSGSVFGLYSSSTVGQAVQLWGDAIIDAAESGGGPMGPGILETIADIFADEDLADQLGRHIGSLMVGLAGTEFFGHPNHDHDTAGHTVADLSNDTCMIAGLRHVITATVAEIGEPGSGVELMSQIEAICPEVLARSLPCSGLGLLTCRIQRMQDLVTVLVTPPASTSGGPPDQCPAIPTVSEWGLIAMTMVGLTVGTISFGRRRQPAT